MTSPHLGKSRSYLTKPEQALLIDFVAAKGENYGRFLDFCDRREIPDDRRFTEDYFHVWCHRHRPAIQIARARHTDVVRSESTLDREKRLTLLEGQVARYRDDIRILTENRDKIEEAIDEGAEGYSRFAPRKIPSVIETRLKVEESLGKALDRIAKERGEYGGAEGKEPPGVNAEMAMMQQMLGQMGPKAITGPRPDDIEGEFLYVEPA